MSTQVQTSSGEATPRLFCRTRLLEDPSRVADALPGIRMAWMSPGTRLAGVDAAWIFNVSRTPDRFAEASAQLLALFSNAEIDDEVDVPGSGPVAFGSFSFDWQESGSGLIVPSVVYGSNDTAAWKTEIRVEPSKNGPRKEDVAPSQKMGGGKSAGEEEGDGGFAEWETNLERVREPLMRGDLQKIVLARKVRIVANSRFNQESLLSTLARQFPGCYTFRFGGFIGASPELLVRKLGAIVDSMPIAGSAPRGTDDATDQRLGTELMASAKNQLEHDLTKDWVVSALRPLCSTVEAEPEPSLLLLSNVQHLSTKVQGRLLGQPDSLQLVGALHPTPAVCGVPGNRAMKMIRSVENFSRGLYAGPVGWMDHRGDGEWAIALRCAEINGSSAALFAGAGILRESDALSEFEETELKLQAIRGALAADPL